MEEEDPREVAGRLLGPVLIAVALIALFVFFRSSGSVDSAAPTTLDFTNRTTVPLEAATTAATTTSTQAPDTDPAPALGYASGWAPLNAGNLGHRRGFVATRAGNRIVVWGGLGPSERGGNPAGGSYFGRTWTEMAPAPVSAGADPTIVWTGSEMFVFSGAAAAWEPDSNTWRELAYPPTGSASGAFPLAGVWTGDQVVLVGYRIHPPTRDDNLFVASYGPDLGCCRTYPDPPFSLTYADAFWTGDEMLLIGALLDPNGEAATDDGLGRMAGFDPVTQEWTEYDAPPLEGRGRLSAAWTGTKLIAWRADGDAAEWTRDKGWRVLPGPSLEGNSCRPRTAAVGEDVFVMLCDRAAVWSDIAQRWFTIWGPDTVDWFSNACVPVPGDTARHRLELWCSTGTGNAFWRIDLSKVEATGYSKPATSSPWELLPNPKATRLDSTTMVWSGDELLYFSGHGIEVEEYGGWGYAPGGEYSHRIAEAPYPGRHGQIALWTGDEMLIWRGSTTLWNPFRLEWRTAAAAPEFDGGWYAVWDGNEAIFYGSRYEPVNLGAAYDPKTDTWREIETGPPAVAVGVQVMAAGGDDVFVFGNYSGSSGSQAGAVYSPATDSWRPLPPIPGEFILSASVGDFVDGEFIVVGISRHAEWAAGDPLVVGLAYSPDEDQWRQIAELRQPEQWTEDLLESMAAVTHGDELAVFLPDTYRCDEEQDNCDPTSIAFYRPSTDTWRYVDGAPASAQGPTMVSGDTFIAYLTSEGTVLLHDD